MDYSVLVDALRSYNKTSGYATRMRAAADAIVALQSDLAAARAERKEIWWLPWEPQEVARRFHLAYEHFAPDFGYETQPDTKVFDPYSANGQLMIAVVRNVLIEQASSKGTEELERLRADLAAARADAERYRAALRQVFFLEHNEREWETLEECQAYARRECAAIDGEKK